jgi:hypothetical protein
MPGRIVVSETEAPNMLASESGMEWMSGSTTRRQRGRAPTDLVVLEVPENDLVILAWPRGR